VFEKLFDRFPNVRMASVENGSEFLADLQNKLTSTHHKMPGYFGEHPVETLKRHWWINPFWEDDVEEVAGLMGTDRVLFGSDWPHIEALPNPLDGVNDYKQFEPADQKKILLDNVSSLNVRRPA
jgi:predicted TIM-barrel fold metal-dependent hydrolase